MGYSLRTPFGRGFSKTLVGKFVGGHLNDYWDKGTDNNQEAAQKEKTDAQNDANAQITAAEYAATAKEGLERLAGKRRRSFASTMIASNNLGSPTVLG